MWIGIISVIALVVLTLVYIYLYSRESKDLKLEKKLRLEIQAELVDRKERVKELNQAVKDDYGINPEVIVQKVVIDFNQRERSAIVLGLEKLAANSTDLSEMKFLISTIEKAYETFLKANGVEYKNGKDK